MPEVSFVSLLIAFMADVAILAGIPLAAATLTGVIVSFLQAITQIQDQTLATTVKISVITFVLLTFGGVLIRPLIISTTQVFDQFYLIVE